jgi:2-iminobutanoate/2-iminopropanoate deaminase
VKTLLIASMALTLAAPAIALEYLKPPTDKRGGYRVPGVVAKAGRTVYLSGHTGERDPSGKSLTGDAEGQTRQAFSNIELTLKQAGASLDNLVLLSIWIRDEKDRPVVAKIRDEILKNAGPASTFLQMTWHPSPEALVYMSGIAVVE